MKNNLQKTYISLLLSFSFTFALQAMVPIHYDALSDTLFNEEQKLGISEISNDSRMISFCFNNVASTTFYSELLELLDKNNIKATFFVDGSKSATEAAMIKRLAGSGHEIASSGMGDDFLTTLESDEIRNRITESDKKIAAVSGKKPLCFMAPEGKYDKQVLEILDEMKKPAISAAVSVDYKPAPSCGDIDIYQQYIVQQIKSGSIIFVSNEHYNLILLRHMLKYLIDSRYEIVSIAEMGRQASDSELQARFH